MIESLRASEGLTGRLRFCSLEQGWRSILIRHYEHPEVVDLFEAPPLSDHNIVLVLKGNTLIESFAHGRWSSSFHVPGSLAMTAPENGTRIRWRGQQRHETLHLVIPKETLASAREELNELAPGFCSVPDGLSVPDPLVSSLLRTIWKAGQDRAPEIYAESAVRFLAIHLLAGRSVQVRHVAHGGEMKRLQRVEEFMRENLSKQLTLSELAAEAGCTIFRLIRLCRAYWDQTPFQRLTRMRMEHGRELLLQPRANVISVALDCGYGNPSHFATAFRRTFGSSPTEYRKLRLP